MLDDLKKIKELYDKNTNIIKYLKNGANSDLSTPEMIMISYDFQAGNYIKKAQENPEWEDCYSGAVVNVLDQLGVSNSILEVGSGEATTLEKVIEKIDKKPMNIFGFDISYSRIQYAMNYLLEKNVDDVELFLGDLFSTPIQDNSIDIVYTSHSLEPNGGREKEALLELYRITNKYLVLFEPAYDLAGEKAKAHIEKHVFVKNLYGAANELGFKVIEHKLLFESNDRSSNNTGVTIIEKEAGLDRSLDSVFACPITKMPMEIVKGNYFCKDSLLLYPIVNNIPCLLPNNAIVATHFLD